MKLFNIHTRFCVTFELFTHLLIIDLFAFHNYTVKITFSCEGYILFYILFYITFLKYLSGAYVLNC